MRQNRRVLDRAARGLSITPLIAVIGWHGRGVLNGALLPLELRSCASKVETSGTVGAASCRSQDVEIAM
eukprot:scaffold21268_cov86-Skeletonema_marinoi.AAC.1